MTYKEFLNSNIWRKYRDLALILFNNKCHFCENGGELHLHHTKYWGRNTYKMSELKKFPKNNFRWFLLLCKNCHKNIHDIQNKTGLDVYKSTKEYKKLFPKKTMWLSKKRVNNILKGYT